jgi:drug/metabolite transporter (DMT)-like permease
MMILLLLGYYALFASALSVNKIILFSLSTWLFVALRRLIAGCILFTYITISSKSERLKLRYIQKDLLTLLYISILTMFIPSILKAYSFQNLVSSKAALLGSLDPFVTALYAYFLWHEKITKNQLFGMLIALCGVFILTTSTSPTEVAAGEWGIISLPELAMIGSLAISRYGWILARDMLKTERYSSSEFNSLLMIISGLYALLATYILGICDFCTIPPTPQFISLFAYSVFFGEIAGYTIYGNLLKKYNITLLSLAGLSIPLFVHLYGPLLLGEPLSPIFFIAFGLVSCGMYIFYRDQMRKIIL